MSKAYITPFTTEEKQFLYSKLYKFNEIYGCYLEVGASTLMDTVSHDQLSVEETNF